MNHDVFFSHRGDNITSMLANSLGKSRCIGGEFQIFARETDNFEQIAKGKHLVEIHYLIRGDCKLFDHKLAKAFGHV